MQDLVPPYVNNYKLHGLRDEMFLRVDPDLAGRQLDDVTCMSGIFDTIKQETAVLLQEQEHNGTNHQTFKVAVYSHKSHKIQGPIACHLGMKDEKLCGLIGCVWTKASSDEHANPNVRASCHFDASYMDNGGHQSFDDIVCFLANANVVFTSSFHGRVWGTMLGKRVIVHGNTALWFKMQSFPYPPTLYMGDFYADCQRAHVYWQALTRCQRQNRRFYLETL